MSLRSERAIGVILFLGMIASVCIGSNTSLEEVSSNPSEFEGEEVVLTGQIGNKEAESTFLERFELDNETLENKVTAFTTSRELGNVNGAIDLVGECNQNDYASRVKVEGEIESYRSCECDYNLEIIEPESKGVYFGIHQDRGIINFSNREELDFFENYEDLGRFYSDFENISDREDFEAIDQRLGKDLSEKLNLEYHFDRNVISQTYYLEDGSLHSYHSESGMRAISGGYKYKLNEQFLFIQNFKTENTTEYGPSNRTREALTQECQPGNTLTTERRGDTYRQVTVEGCNSDPERNYYLACNRVSKQYE